MWSQRDSALATGWAVPRRSADSRDREAVVNGSLVADLGIGPEVWVFGALLLCVTLFFKFGRFWSIRNLDLLLIFALAPGMMILVSNRIEAPWWAFFWLFVGSFLWLVRSLLDLGLTRRPLLEPNLNASGLACLAIGVIGLFVAETVSLPVDEGAKRNPADSKSDKLTEKPPGESMVEHAIQHSPLASSLKTNETPRVILKRVLACLGHIGLVVGLIAVGWRHFDRPIAGLSVATCYLLLPYSRFALVDTGQLIPAACIVTALVFYNKPSLTGALIGLAAGWMPACVGLIPLWAGFYRKRGFWRFLGVGVAVAATCGLLGLLVPGLDAWARALGARSLAEAGLLPGVEAPASGSFWSGIDPSYRLPVLIAYLALVIGVTLLPAEKNLGELIALSAALLVASQFWYLDAGGTLVVLYLPLVILIMFRPNLATKRVLARGPKNSSKVQSTLFSDY
jgi:hypothetical protein